MSKVSIDRELLERLVSGWTQSTDVFGPMRELRAAMAQPAPAQDERIMAKARELFGWAAGVGGFEDAVNELVAFVIGHARPAQTEQQPTYVECRECTECGHAGINDQVDGDSACSHCLWHGPSPDEDKCPECQREGTMSASCPQCGCRYRLIAGADIAAPIAQTAPVNQATDGGRNPLYEGLFEGETEQQRTERLASAQTTPQPEQSGWISVTDKLPELDVPVWLHHGDGAIILGERASSTDGWMWGTSYGLYFNGGHWTAVECNPDGDIEPAHWMPLPAAPASGDAA